ncbi:MAG: hypothetical protein ACK5TO_04730 [Planctomycetaceae bacterium]|jgi:hypothetical protein
MSLAVCCSHLLPRVAAVAFAWGLCARWGTPVPGDRTLGSRARLFNLGAVAWRVGCGLLWLHVMGSWWMVHSASWDRAWQHTAEVTERMTGFNTGMGVIWNLVALAAWTADCCAGWPAVPPAANPASVPSRWRRVVEIYLAFLWFQAAVVFATPAARAVMLALCLGVVGVIVASRSSRGD